MSVKSARERVLITLACQTSDVKSENKNL